MQEITLHIPSKLGLWSICVTFLHSHTLVEELVLILPIKLDLHAQTLTLFAQSYNICPVQAEGNITPFFTYKCNDCTPQCIGLIYIVRM